MTPSRYFAPSILVVGAAIFLTECSGPDPSGPERPLDTPIILTQNVNGQSTLALLDPSSGSLDTIISISGLLQRPVWSPDYTAILYLRTDGIWTVDRDGTDNRRILPIPADLESIGPATMTPDGQRLALRGRINALSCGLFVVRLADSSLTALPTPTSCPENPVWSPDGTRLAYTGFYPQQAGPDRRGLFVIHSDGTGNRLLRSDAAGASEPAWSPNGRHIVFMSDYAGPLDIWTIDSDGSNPQRRTNDPGEDHYHPAWSPDGASLIFAQLPTSQAPGLVLTVSLRSAALDTVATIDALDQLSW